ncbi:MAG: hypothetical protein L0Y66_02245 [Myxococcaceae bacterium]|nr:hypothetical protein [Myxococcaceae bacterium]MCI0669954.1 hypothetical protein [Myxococcaceae bacterium]
MSHHADDCLDWQAQRAEFEPDGSLRDIYIQDAAPEDWRLVLSFLEQGPYGARLSRREEQSVVSPMPQDVGLLFDGSHSYLLHFSVGEVLLACHFFTPEEIEFDFAPNGLSEGALRELLRFMAQLGDLTKKRVVMTPENAPELPIYEYDPVTRRMGWVAPQRG